MMRRLRVLALCVFMATPPHGAAGGDPVKPAGPVDLRDAELDDRASSIAVPVSGDSSLVVSLPSHFWVRSSPRCGEPKSFEGSGLILEYVDDLANGGFRSIVYVGSTPLLKSKGDESPSERLRRAAADFVASLGDKYRRQQHKLLTDVADVQLDESSVQVDRRELPAVRTTRYNTKATARSDQPVIVRTGEAVFFRIDGADRLAYIVVDTTSGGATLDMVVGSMSVRRAAAANGNGRVVKLVETSPSSTLTPVARFVTYDEPAWFVQNFTMPNRDAFVYVGDRLDEAGEVTGSYLIRNRTREEATGAGAEAAKQMQLLGVTEPGSPTLVALATLGVEATVYSYPTTVDGKRRAEGTAVFIVDDQVWSLTWNSLGSEARVSADRATFLRLLRGMQVAVR